MKHEKIFILTILLFFLAGITIAQPTTQKTVSPQTKTTPAVKLTNAVDSSQYILGAYLGQYLKANGISVTKPDLFIRGIDDVLGNKTLLVNADSVPKRMNEFLTRMSIERNRLMEKQLFDAVKGQPGVGSLPNGVCYVIVKAGTGMRPEVGDSITIHVKGFLPDGKQFEDTYPKNNPLKTTPGTLIPGLKETIQIMPAGSLWRIYIPSALAYAETGVPGIIPPYSAIVFDIELLSIKGK
jgi:FKBP-type peptidyl-prolyl cis-trans isomerase